MISRVEDNLQVGILLLEIFDDRGEERLLGRIRVARVDDQLFRMNGESS